jgi:hypothetical protein
MKIRGGQLLLLLVLGAILLGAGGCASDEPQNEAVRPWNTPQDWENGMPLMNEQHE